jgi:hypothetical protein
VAKSGLRSELFPSKGRDFIKKIPLSETGGLCQTKPFSCLFDPLAASLGPQTVHDFKLRTEE